MNKAVTKKGKKGKIAERRGPKRKITYDPNKHIVPMEYNHYLEAIDESENRAMRFIERQVGSERFEELQNEYMMGKNTDLKDIAMLIAESVASLFKTPQQQFEYSPYNLGDEDFQPSKNFYSPKNFDTPLGTIDDD